MVLWRRCRAGLWAPTTSTSTSTATSTATTSTTTYLVDIVCQRHSCSRSVAPVRSVLPHPDADPRGRYLFRTFRTSRTFSSTTIAHYASNDKTPPLVHGSLRRGPAVKPRKTPRTPPPPRDMSLPQPEVEPPQATPFRSIQPVRDLVLDVLRGLPSAREARQFLQRSHIAPPKKSGPADGTQSKGARRSEGGLERNSNHISNVHSGNDAKAGGSDAAPSGSLVVPSAGAGAGVRERDIQQKSLEAADTAVENELEARYSEKLSIAIIVISPQTLTDSQLSVSLGNVCSRLKRLTYTPVVVLDYRKHPGHSSPPLASASDYNQNENQNQNQTIKLKRIENVDNNMQDMKIYNFNSANEDVVGDSVQSDSANEPHDEVKHKPTSSKIPVNSSKREMTPRPGYSPTMFALMNEVKQRKGSAVSESANELSNEGAHSKEEIEVTEKIDDMKLTKATVTKTISTKPNMAPERISDHGEIESYMDRVKRHEASKFREDSSFQAERVMQSLSSNGVRSVPMNGFVLSEIEATEITYSQHSKSGITISTIEKADKDELSMEDHDQIGKHNDKNLLSIDFSRLLKFINMGIIPIVTPIGIDNLRSRYIYTDPRVNCIKLCTAFNHLLTKDTTELEKEVGEDLNGIDMSGNIRIVSIQRFGGFLLPPPTSTIPISTSMTNPINTSRRGDIGHYSSWLYKVQTHLLQARNQLKFTPLINLSAESHNLIKGLEETINNLKGRLLKSRQITHDSHISKAFDDVDGSKNNLTSKLFTRLRNTLGTGKDRNENLKPSLKDSQLNDGTGTNSRSKQYQKDIRLSIEELIKRFQWQQDVVGVMKKCLDILPSQATGILVHPSHSTQSVVHHIITDKPINMSSDLTINIPSIYNNNGNNPVIKSSQNLTSIWECSQPTIIRRGLPVRIIKGTEVWINALSRVNNVIEQNKDDKTLGDKELNKRIIDSMDENIKKIFVLLEASFGRNLRVKEFITRMSHVCEEVIIAGDFEGCAIITLERTYDPVSGTDIIFEYLDKFAVHPKSQGSGAADIVWREVVSPKRKSIMWRSRTANPVNGWYFARSNAVFRLEGGYWTLFVAHCGGQHIIDQSHEFSSIGAISEGTLSIPASFY